MAENGGQKDEEKLDFDSAGQAIGYISLDQARVLAMCTARETPGEYGRRFANVPMAFEVVQDEETEDHYVVTLSVRPQGPFTGTPGQEQFFIEKEGTVAHRQVLGFPGGGRRIPLIPVSIGLAAVVIAAVVIVVFVGDRSGSGDGEDNPSVALVPTSTPAPTITPTPAAVPTTAATAAPAPVSTPVPAPIVTTTTVTAATAALAPTTVPAATVVPRPAATAPTATAPTARPPAAGRGTSKVETLVLGVDPRGGETNLPWGGIVDHHQQFDLVMEVLVDISPETALFVPELAKSWELSEDSSEWRFQLEEGVQWHNNWGEFTSADVFHSIAMWQRDDSLLAFSNDWREIDLDQSAMVGPYEVNLRLKNPNPDYLFVVSPGGGGLMMSKAQWDADGDEGYEQDMIGTGAYRYTGRTYGVNTTYELLPDHWRVNNPAPDFQKMEIRWIQEPATRNAALLAGETHFTEITRDQSKAAVQNNGMKIISSNFPGNGAYVVFQGLNAKDPGFETGYSFPELPYTDVRVREAMNRAVDRRKIVDAIFDGRANIGFTSGFWKQMPGWDESWVTNFERDYGYDPDRARELLAEAGYPNGFEIRGFLMNFPGWPKYIDVMEAVGVDLANIGIKLTLEQFLFPNYLASYMAKREEANGLWIIPNSPIDVQSFLTLTSWSEGAMHHAEFPEFDPIFNAMRAEGNVDIRHDQLRSLGQLYYDEYAYLTLFHTFIEWTANPNIVDQWPFPGSDGANYGHWDLITACFTEEPCLD